MILDKQRKVLSLADKLFPFYKENEFENTVNMAKFTDTKVNLKESVMDHIRAVSVRTEDKWEDIKTVGDNRTFLTLYLRRC